jgi:hypothetical protein
MSNQITTMKTSTIVAITVGTLVTGFLGTCFSDQCVKTRRLPHTLLFMPVGLTDLLLQLMQSTSITKDEQILDSGKP